MPSLRPLAPPRCLASSRGSSSSYSHLAPFLNNSCTATATATITTPQTRRSLSTTPQHQRQTPSHLTVPKDQVPAYPYGRFQLYKQRNEGLFGRSKIRFGNTISERYDRKARVTWLPNRHTKRLWSPSLQAFLRTRMTAQVLRTIDRLGGIDEYLLGGKQKRIKELGPAGWALRWKIMQTPAVKARFAREREALGLPPKVEEEVQMQADAEVGEVLVQGTAGGEEKVGAQAVHDLVDEMIARDEEFVLGSEEDASSRGEVEVESEDAKQAGSEAEAEPKSKV